MDIEEKYAWSRKGKTYKTKYFKALGQLFGDDIKANPEPKVKQSKNGNEYDELQFKPI